MRRDGKGWVRFFEANGNYLLKVYLRSCTASRNFGNDEYRKISLAGLAPHRTVNPGRGHLRMFLSNDRISKLLPLSALFPAYPNVNTDDGDVRCKKKVRRLWAFRNPR